MSSNLIRPRNIAALVIGTIAAAGIYDFIYLDSKAKEEHDLQVKMNLAPSSLFIGRRACPENFRLENADVNKDGNYESVLRYTNPLTQKQEEVLVEKCEEELCFRHFRVENGKINYLLQNINH